MEPVFIKPEEEYDLGDYRNLDIPELNFDVKVEVEDDSLNIDKLDWCIGNKIHEVIENDQEQSEVISYDHLTQKSKQKCHLCNRIFDNRYSLLQHNLTHLQVRFDTLLYKCDICSTYCDSEDKIKHHIDSKHSTENEAENNNEVFENGKHLPVTKTLHQCSECGKLLPYKSWHSHVREVHCRNSIECSKCNTKFKCHRYLKRHMLYKHSNVKPSWRFFNIRNTEDINCEQCDAVFKNKNSYATHVRNCHSEEAQCDICKSKLKSKAYLLTHMRRVHYNDGKEHKCDICRKNFKSPRYVRIHKKNSHCHIVIL